MTVVELPAGAAEDPEAALPWVRAVLERTSAARGWSPDSLSAALQSVDRAFSEADEASWWGADPQTFWAALERETQNSVWGQEPGGADLALLWSTTAGWTSEVENQEQAENLAVQVAGPVTASAEDIGAAATAVKAEAQKPTSWALLALGAAVVAIAVLRR